MKCASFFAGVGGIDLGFQNFNLVYANEIDDYAIKTYETNHPIQVDRKDIRDVDANSLPDFDILLAGFPCQPFSLAGYREGFEDKKDRGNLFFELERIYRAKKPEIVFLENVKNLVGHDNGNTFSVILESLKNSGYHVKHKVLNAMHFGNIPQNRERIYIVAFLDQEKYFKFDFPDPIVLENKISDIVDFGQKVDSKYYYSEKYKMFETLKENINNPETIYQWRRKYVRENKNNVCPTLTANMGEGGHNVPLILTKHGIRKLTPIECFKMQGFPSNFTLPKDLSDTKAYKQAGNSVVVPVIHRIAEQISKTL
jgi:DNA (cytosine-5)-methyltransferase 1